MDHQPTRTLLVDSFGERRKTFSKYLAALEADKQSGRNVDYDAKRAYDLRAEKMFFDWPGNESRRRVDRWNDILGDIGEVVPKHLGIQANYSVLPLSKIDTGGAPMAVDNEESIVAPDHLFSVGQGRTMGVECKAKYLAIYHGLSHRYRLGLNLATYRQYLEFQKRWGYPVYVSILVLFWGSKDITKPREVRIRAGTSDEPDWLGTLYMQRLDALGNPQDTFPERGAKGAGNPAKSIAVWDADKFRIAFRFDAPELVCLWFGTWTEVPNVRSTFDAIWREPRSSARPGSSTEVQGTLS